MLRSSFQPVAMLLPCKKWKWTWESESEKQLPSCWHVVAMQKVKVNVRKWKWERAVAMQLTVPQEELPLNILCRLCCQWKLPSCICRTGNRIAAVQQLKFHFWAGLFSQRLSVSVLIKVLSWIPVASPLTMMQHNWDLMHVGKMCEVFDVQMDVNVVAMLLPCCCHSVERFCTRVVESKSLKVGKSLKIGKKFGKSGFYFLLDFLANMPKCHKMPKCLHFGSGSCIRIFFLNAYNSGTRGPT